VNTPDPTLPFFAYGLLKPGQPAFFQIRDYVPVAGCVTAHAPGILLNQDGLPILKKPDSESTEGESPSVDGVLVTFKNKSAARKAYKTIQAFEPESMYQWDTVVVADRCANVLYAAHPEAGNAVYLWDWDGWKDPLLDQALPFVEKPGIKRPSKNAPTTDYFGFRWRTCCCGRRSSATSRSDTALVTGSKSSRPKRVSIKSLNETSPRQSDRHQPLLMSGTPGGRCSNSTHRNRASV
jgi:hypothetical protein